MSIETRLTPSLIAEFVGKGQWPNTTVGDRLDRVVQRHPDKTAIIDSQRRVTFAELGSLVDRLALGLHELGVRRGDVVTGQLPNRIEAMAVYFAVGKIGAVLAPVVPYYRASEMSYILERSESVAVVIPDTFGGFDYPEMVDKMRPGLPALKHVIVAGETVPQGAISFRELAGEKTGARPPANSDSSMKARLAKLKPDANDPLVLCFTSGTEAAPKAPIWTHNTVHGTVSYNEGFQFTEKDVVFSFAPAYHAFGMGCSINLALSTVGATCVWMDAFEPEAAMQLIEREKVTAVLGVPPQLMGLLNHPNLRKHDFSSLRVFVAGAAPMPSEGIRRLRAELGCSFVTLWGASESTGGPITHLDDPPEISATTVGKAHTDLVEVVVFDERKEKILPPGQPGEMAIRGPFLHAGYFKDPELTKRSFHPDGWFFTGDSVVISEEGHISFVSRIKDIINRGGEKISPREVEEHLYAHPKVLTVAMVGMPDPRLGERNCVYVVPRAGETVTLEEIVSFLTDRGVAKVKLPERLEVVDSLPMTASGKVRKVVLREDVTRKLQQESQ
ncbi:MAG: AMP-binding protein [Dehalococcoidia bacterium]|nr:AMP-binding protein [Dehalococcoidia bacterium]